MTSFSLSRLSQFTGAALFCLSACASPDEGTEGIEGVCDQADKPSDDYVCTETVSGQVLDGDEQPIEGLKVTVCGPICFIGETDAAGEFAVELNTWMLPDEYSLQPHGSPSRTTFYYKFPEGFEGGDYDNNVLHALEMPDGEALLTFRDDESGPAQTVESGGATLSVPEGVQVRPDVSDLLDGGEALHFRALALSEEEKAKFSDDFAGKVTWAFAPFETVFSEAGDRDARTSPVIELPNSEQWPAGASVDVEALGSYLDPEGIAPAQMSPVGTAAVSSDAASVVLDFSGSDIGVSRLTWLTLALQE